MPRELIYKDEAYSAVLHDNPASAYCINRIKPVDAVEVKHGWWEERLVDYESQYYTTDCSICGCSGERWYSYCPNCGAKMDGGNEDV
jgi:hypothetical protein